VNRTLTRAPVLHVTVGDSIVRARAMRADVAIWAGEATYESPDDLAEVVARLAAVLHPVLHAAALWASQTILHAHPLTASQLNLKTKIQRFII